LGPPANPERFTDEKTGDQSAGFEKIVGTKVESFGVVSHSL